MSCGAEAFSEEEVLGQYHESEQQQVVQSAAMLVDGGRAGDLSRVEELLEFISLMGYRKVGLAYCYGMERSAQDIMSIFAARRIEAVSVSCTVGGLSQSSINDASVIEGVSCSPINQALQLEREGADLAVLVGLCLGHDILFQRSFPSDVTTLVVKDRVYAHSPLKGIEALAGNPQSAEPVL